MAFIDLGDQFINLTRAAPHGGPEARHFGLVVDDRSTVRALAEAEGAPVSLLAQTVQASDRKR